MSWARCAAVLVVLGGLMLATACDAERSTDAPPTESSPAVPEVFFAERLPGGDDMLSEIRGELVLDGRGCLHVRSGGSPTVVWPAGFEPHKRRVEVRVIDREGRIAARVGEEVHMGGGESPISGNGAVAGRTKQELRERCPGEYWIAAPPVRVPR